MLSTELIPVSSPSPPASPSKHSADPRYAVVAYYDGYDEVVRLLQSGGVDEPTDTMRRTMSGEYLDFMTNATKPRKLTFEGAARIDGYSISSESDVRISILGCENESHMRAFDSGGNEVTAEASGLRARRVVALKGDDGRWRIDRSVSAKYVEAEDWAAQPCMEIKEKPA